VSERRVTVADAAGLHARQAARVVRLASRFEARMVIRHAERTADARSLLELLALGVGPGTQVTLQGEGPDAEVALAALALELGSVTEETGADASAAPSSAGDG
jgi:phosphotransferase system HPr (HPr) family protein